MGKKIREKLHRAQDAVRNALDMSSSNVADAGEGQTAPEKKTEPVAMVNQQDEANGKQEPAIARANTGDQNQSNGSLKRTNPHDEDDDGGEWQVVSRPSKKTKTKKVPRPGKGSYPAITFSPNSRLNAKINVSSLRDLVTYIFADGPGPQWVGITHRPEFRKIVAVMVPGLEEAMFKSDVDFATFNDDRTTSSGSDNDDDKANANAHAITSPDDYYPRPLSKDKLPDPLKPFADMFPHLWPVRTPGDDRHNKMHSPLAAFLTAPAPKEKTGKKGVKPATEPQGWKNARTPITEFLATADELEDNGFLIHPALLPEGDRRANFVCPDGWVVTKVDALEDGQVPEAEIEKGSVTAGREVLALDCEMCMTGENELSLTRISLVNWAGEVVLDELVKPDKTITDYVTQFSGITEAMLAPVTTTLRDIQAKVLELLTPRTILVGHSLESDTKALQLAHPFIVDTSILYPHPRGPPLKSSLKYLAQKYLSREIQSGGAHGHNSIEDALTCLDLVKQKCDKGKLWGTSDAQGENLFRRLARAGVAYKAQGGQNAVGGVEVGKTSAAIDWGDPSKGAGAGATYQLGCKNDDDVTRNVIRAVNGDPDGLEIRGGGVDFVWARMRELEALQGWWNNNRAENPGSSDKGPPDGAEPGSRASTLEQAVAALTERLVRIHDALPPCTAFIVFSGSGDPRDMARLQQVHARWRKEYNTPGIKWDQLSIKWTDVEEQALKRAVKKARSGIGFISVK